MIPSAISDRNLLFGILALQNELVTRDQLIAAMNDWVLAKDRMLGDLLRERGALKQEDQLLVESLLHRNLQQFNQDAGRCLRELSLDPSMQEGFSTLSDSDVQASLSLVGTSTAAERGTRVQRPEAVAGRRYRVLRPHARGGLGEVFIAEDMELHREVALKEIRPAYAHERQGQARFQMEAEITGRLEHPGIVPVYGMGTYADGRPYYAMRLIRGVSLKDAIERFHGTRKGESKPIGGSFDAFEFRQLLGRFVSVCNVIAYAHSRGVLHRDLKPSNVMLGPFGETLVVDWGLAKIVGTQRSETSCSMEGTLRLDSESGHAGTVAGAAMGTPAFMSPEQAEGKIDTLGPASDVYSLGATLFCLLTGQNSVAGDSPAAVLDKVRQGNTIPLRSMRPDVPKPLEAICSKAMALRPNDRYPSAEDLAQDLERWLADEPVAAYREPLTVRSLRWMRNHRTLVSSSAAVLVVGMISLFAANLLLNAKNTQLKAALSNESQARSVAMGALRNLTDDVVHRQLARGVVLTADDKRFLRNIQQQYEEFASLSGEDAQQRSIRGEGHYNVGLLRQHLGESADAEVSYRRALEIYGQLAADFPDQSDYRNWVARCSNSLGILFGRSGRFQDAEKSYVQAIAILDQLSRNHPTQSAYRRDLAECQNNLGNLYQVLGKISDAATVYQHAQTNFRQLTTDFPGVVEFQEGLGSSNINLGNFLSSVGRSEEAEQAYREALAVFQNLVAHSPANPDFRNELAAGYNNLGILQSAQGRFDEAETAYHQALTIRRNLVAEFPIKPNFRQELARNYASLANLLSLNQRPDEAEAAYLDSILLRKQLANEFPAQPEFRQELARSHNNLGYFYQTRGDVNHAKQSYTEALNSYKQLVNDNPEVPAYRNSLAGALGNLALVAQQDQDYTQARVLLEQAMPQHLAALKSNSDHPTYRQFYQNNLLALAVSCAGQKDKSAALQAANTLRDVGWDAPRNAYDAACAMSQCLSLAQEEPESDDRSSRLQFYGEQAMGLLRDAVAKGFKNAEQMESEQNFEPLRQRGDFQQLLAELRGQR